MIYFIKKTVTDNEEVLIEYQHFDNVEKCKEKINKDKSIVPNFIISSTMGVYDISYQDAVILITDDKNIKIVADILMNGIRGNKKPDEFILETIQEVHKDKIKSTSISRSTSSSRYYLEKAINQCRDECLSACANGISSSKKISLAFFELKCLLGLNIVSKNA